MAFLLGEGAAPFAEGKVGVEIAEPSEAIRPRQKRRRGTPRESARPGTPALPTLLREQYGLELKPERAPVPVLVITHAQRPLN